MSQYLDKDGASRIAENFLSKQAEQDDILQNLQFDLKEAEHALVKTIQGPAPLNIRALTRPLDDYVISGNTIQDGTPTPEAPVDVVGCGVKTGNLFYKTLSGMNIDANGRIISNTDFDLAVARVTAGETYSVTGCSGVMAFYVGEPGLSSRSYNNTRESIVSPVTIPQGVNYVAYRVADRPNYAQLNTGSTPLPYEPYGYKLPLTVNGTEYPIYLGQVESTRRIKKLVLTGNEPKWNIASTSLWHLQISNTPAVTILDSRSLYCTHYNGVASKTTYSGLTNGNACIYNSIFIWIRDSQFASLADFKSYLAAQYAAGTPVTVWYVLATPEIAVINEPLHKIGDYADTVSMTQAGIEISTTKGFNTITTDTTVLPSNIEVKGVINNA